MVMGAGPAEPVRAIGRHAVAVHSRLNPTRSVRLRIVLPVVLALAGVASLATIQTIDGTRRALDASRADTVAGVTAALTALGHEVVAEYVLTTSVGRTNDDRTGLTQQRATTDAARNAYQEIAPPVLATMPELIAALRQLTQALAGLDLARGIVDASGSVSVRGYYDQILVTIERLAGALPSYMSDKQLIELGRAMDVVLRLDWLGALQLNVINRSLARGRLLPQDHVALSGWVGAANFELESLRPIAPAGDLHAVLLRRPEVAAAVAIRQGLLNNPPGRVVPAGADATDWSTGESQYLYGLRAIHSEVSRRLIAGAHAQLAAARARAILIVAASLAIALTSLTGATVVAVRIGRRLQRTRAAALSAARFELPAAIEALRMAPDAAQARQAMAQATARLDSVLAQRPDEIGALAEALGAVHRQALRLAADQAITHIDVQATFRALSRRGQTLVQRQIRLLDDFSRDEVDPAVLGRLFALDHLAARMRRNEENVLVLAGGEPGRWITRAVTTQDILRAAAQEIEEYKRVQIHDVATIAVAARFAGDTIHLLAELLENATRFSPPDLAVWVGTHRTAQGLVITVTDGGIGMPPAALAEANQRLARPGSLNSSLVGTMGLLVVARLAQRHSIHVRLASAPAKGVTATVLLPERLLTAPPAEVISLALRPAVTWQQAEARGARVEYRGGHGVTRAVTVPDPEDVRTRLSSLASGIAAATQRADRSSTNHRPS